MYREVLVLVGFGVVFMEFLNRFFMLKMEDVIKILLGVYIYEIILIVDEVVEVKRNGRFFVKIIMQGVLY